MTIERFSAMMKLRYVAKGTGSKAVSSTAGILRRKLP
jgi:hypothetical protein